MSEKRAIICPIRKFVWLLTIEEEKEAERVRKAGAEDIRRYHDIANTERITIEKARNLSYPKINRRENLRKGDMKERWSDSEVKHAARNSKGI